MIGETIGNYRVTGQIGAGGMGAVYEAEHVLMGKKAAVKVLLPELSTNRNIVERFFNEAKATAVIQHPGIVEIYDYGHLPSGHAYIVMERLVGESLADRIARVAPMPADQAASIARHIAAVLESAHEHGIVHRDLKPDNVYLIRDPAVPGGERAKILDFGIAKLASGTGSGSVRTQTGAVMGTPIYMAPEQCKGAGAVDHRADIYALGCVLFEMVCGGPPFAAEGSGEILAAHIHLPPPMPSTINRMLSPALEATILKLLEKNPDDRYQTMGDVIRALDAVTGHRYATARPSQLPAAPLAAAPMHTPVGIPTTLGSAAGQSVQLTAEGGRRGSWLVPVLALVAAVGGGVAYVVATRGAGSGGGDEARPAAAAPAPIPTPTGDQPAPAVDEPAASGEPAAADEDEVSLRIESKPPGAKLFRAADGVLIGETPHEVRVRKGPGEAVFILKLRGHEDATVSLPTTADALRIVELERRTKKHPAAASKPPPDTPKSPDDGATKKKKKTVRDGAIDPFGDSEKSKDGAYKPF